EVKDFGGADNQQGPKSTDKSKVELVNGPGTVNSGPAGTAANISQDATTGTSGTITNGANNSITAVTPGVNGTSAFTSSDVANNYSNDEVVEAINVAQGATTANHLSVIVDDGTPLATQNAIKSAAQAYLGGNAADSFSFSVAPFHKPTTSVNGAAARRAAIGMYFKWLVAGLGLLGMAFLLRRQLNQRTEELLYPIDEPFLLEQGGFEPIPLAELEAAVAAATTMDNQKRLDLQRKVEAIALEKPQDVATALRGWLHDDADDRGFDYSGAAGTKRR
ncbi:MAG: hypothetical protein H7123_04960, partial [Thermoleophilia bacterium]|nr:hypothetical protein [Thermoleophilia bacterium]